MKTWWYSLALLGFTGWLAALLIWRSVPVFAPMQTLQPECTPQAPAWPAARSLKILSFNAQYMAGKKYVFYYDVQGGPNKRPEATDVRFTLERVAALIRNENPDIVLLQEINDGDDSRTHFIDQLAGLQQLLADMPYACVARAYYWKAGWVPHPNILGPVSMELVTLSRYRLAAATRYQLPLMDNDFATRHFYFQRALLEARLVLDDGSEAAILNTHLDAWGQGGDLMPRQVGVVMKVLATLDDADVPWIVGGDFNVLPPDGGRQWQRLQNQYDRDSALAPMYARYGAIPALSELLGDDPARWYTHFPNDPAVSGPDRTIDYFFYSHHWQLQAAEVRQRDTLRLSDHLPLIARWTLLKPAD